MGKQWLANDRKTGGELSFVGKPELYHKQKGAGQQRVTQILQTKVRKADFTRFAIPVKKMHLITASNQDIKPFEATCPKIPCLNMDASCTFKFHKLSDM